MTRAEQAKRDDVMIEVMKNVDKLGAEPTVKARRKPSWVAYVTFEDTQEGKLLFTSYGTTSHQMFVLFTISNNPDVWILAYKASRWYYFLFI